MVLNKSDRWYVVLAVCLWVSLIIGSLLSDFNIIDLGYLIILIVYFVRYFVSKKKKIIS